MRTREKKQKKCKYCNKLIPNRNMFCNNQCQQDYKKEQYINEWKKGERKGYRGKSMLISNYVKEYLRSRNNNQCEMCGWSMVNEFTGKVPLEVDHIDGDASNCKEENLRLICPNCHSLTPTFKNIGSRVSKRGRS